MYFISWTHLNVSQDSNRRKRGKKSDSESCRLRNKKQRKGENHSATCNWLLSESTFWWKSLGGLKWVQPPKCLRVDCEASAAGAQRSGLRLVPIHIWAGICCLFSLFLSTLICRGWWSVLDVVLPPPQGDRLEKWTFRIPRRSWEWKDLRAFLAVSEFRPTVMKTFTFCSSPKHVSPHAIDLELWS